MDSKGLRDNCKKVVLSSTIIMRDYRPLPCYNLGFSLPGHLMIVSEPETTPT